MKKMGKKYGDKGWDSRDFLFAFQVGINKYELSIGCEGKWLAVRGMRGKAWIMNNVFSWGPSVFDGLQLEIYLPSLREHLKDISDILLPASLDLSFKLED